MNEKTFKAMTGIGASCIVVGIVILVAGMACGILSIINGAKLFREKSEIIF
jgi:hypothetical protein